MVPLPMDIATSAARILARSDPVDFIFNISKVGLFSMLVGPGGPGYSNNGADLSFT